MSKREALNVLVALSDQDLEWVVSRGLPMVLGERRKAKDGTQEREDISVTASNLKFGYIVNEAIQNRNYALKACRVVLDDDGIIHINLCDSTDRDWIHDWFSK